MYSSEIKNDGEKADFIRKGNELFNKGDIILAYKCYTMADYSAGIEKIADHYFYNEKSPAKAIVLYKNLAKTTGSQRVQEKLDEVAQKIVKVIRKWVEEDKLNEHKEASIDDKRKYLSALVDQQKNKFHTREPIKDTANKTNNPTTKESITTGEITQKPKTADTTSKDKDKNKDTTKKSPLDVFKKKKK